MRIDETVVTQTYPLLPYIFFDSTSAEISDKYTGQMTFRDKTEFDEQELPKKTLGIYYNLFDIVGHRMNKYPESKITVTGNSDGSEIEDPQARLALAKQRAEVIKDYLVKNWNIDESRISTSARDKPLLPTSNDYYEGYEENRRAEISAKDPRLLRPVIHSRFIENAINKDKVEFLVSSEPVQIRQFNIALKSKDGAILDHVYGEDSLPNGMIGIDLDWKLYDKLIDNTLGEDSLLAEIQVVHTNGDVESHKEYIQISRNTNQFEIGRLNLIVFDFDKSDISQQNKDMIENFIENSIKDDSRTRIIGSTDRLGEKRYNMRLSRDRANAVHKYLRGLNPNVTFSEIKGIGDQNLRYDNDTPEGRFYCRTVLIEVKTPFKKEEIKE